MSSENQTKKRVNYTAEERRDLMEILSRYPMLIGKATDNKGIAVKRSAWEKVTKEFNSVDGHLVERTTDQLKKLWENKKNEYKKKLVQTKEKIRGTGGGPYSIETINEDPHIELLMDTVDIELQSAKDCDRIDEEVMMKPVFDTSVRIIEVGEGDILLDEDETTNQLEYEIVKEATVEIAESEAITQSRKRKAEKSTPEKSRGALVQNALNERKRMMDVEHQWKKEEHNLRMLMLQAKLEAYKAKRMHYEKK